MLEPYEIRIFIAEYECLLQDVFQNRIRGFHVLGQQTDYGSFRKSAHIVCESQVNSVYCQPLNRQAGHRHYLCGILFQHFRRLGRVCFVCHLFAYLLHDFSDRLVFAGRIGKFVEVLKS